MSVKAPKAPSLTRETIAATFDVSPEHGTLIKKNARGRGGKIGQHAGTITQYGYRQIYIDGHQILAHRLMWFWVYGEWPVSLFIDHINGRRDDNRIANLRLATKAQNNVNSKIQKNNSSGFRGVCFKRNEGRWVAQIKVNRKQIRLGSFDNKVDAAIAYQDAAQRYYGEFVRP